MYVCMYINLDPKIILFSNILYSVFCKQAKNNFIVFYKTIYSKSLVFFKSQWNVKKISEKSTKYQKTRKKNLNTK